MAGEDPITSGLRDEFLSGVGTECRLFLFSFVAEKEFLGRPFIASWAGLSCSKGRYQAWSKTLLDAVGGIFVTFLFLSSSSN
ncbi:hypothetical protein CEXT_243091 [Caerostris extrusa]|uniref:Uncharacterized protein n=1 Tax=Caerostris extrusa TaxID=172846 RepID=A0AAV4S693_CAEEX|nr:hypothetical protein CEXT_243091 [Caerostris extrusa]